jgi:hypothetical protein
MAPFTCVGHNESVYSQRLSSTLDAISVRAASCTFSLEILEAGELCATVGNVESVSTLSCITLDVRRLRSTQGLRPTPQHGHMAR